VDLADGERLPVELDDLLRAGAACPRHGGAPRLDDLAPRNPTAVRLVDDLGDALAAEPVPAPDLRQSQTLRAQRQDLLGARLIDQTQPRIAMVAPVPLVIRVVMTSGTSRGGKTLQSRGLSGHNGGLPSSA